MSKIQNGCSRSHLILFFSGIFHKFCFDWFNVCLSIEWKRNHVCIFIYNPHQAALLYNLACTHFFFVGTEKKKKQESKLSRWQTKQISTDMWFSYLSYAIFLTHSIIQQSSVLLYFREKQKIHIWKIIIDVKQAFCKKCIKINIKVYRSVLSSGTDIAGLMSRQKIGFLRKTIDWFST